MKLILVPSLIAFVMTQFPTNFVSKVEDLNLTQPKKILVVSVADQKMVLFNEGKPVGEYIISTAKNGVGQKLNSNKTPLGLHRIKQKVGRDAPIGAIFESRVFKGEIWRPDSTPATDSENQPQESPRTSKWSEKDLITSRLLWLEGLEPGFNLGQDPDGNVVDSSERYIYIHGTNHESEIGKPTSHGCVRMMNDQVIELFNLVEEGDWVWIQE
jgi:hypothetical protein